MNFNKVDYNHFSVELIPCLSDNYTYAITCKSTSQLAILDPATFSDVKSYLDQTQKIPNLIFLTHVHPDHVGGVEDLVKTFPEIKVYGSALQQKEFPAIRYPLREKNSVQVGDCSFQILETGGHSHGDISYHNSEVVFVGDCLFMGGVGRVFTGDYAQMFQSVDKLLKLKEESHLYCGHEYTENNIRFAMHVEPDNHVLKDLSRRIFNLRAKNLPSLPSAIGFEKMINPFCRLDTPVIRMSLQRKYKTLSTSLVERFKLLREWKDSF